jgi:four helix bundle protein
MKSRIGSFEDLIAWQKARVLTREIYLRTGRGSFARDFGLAGQIQRAAVSVMSNIAEGFERGGRNEFHNFLVMAKASSGEVQSQLFVALDVGHISEDEFHRLRDLSREVSRILGGLRAAVARQRAPQRNQPQKPPN